MLPDADTFYGRVGDGLRSLAIRNRNMEAGDVYHYSAWVLDLKCGVRWTAVGDDKHLHEVTLSYLAELRQLATGGGGERFPWGPFSVR